MIAGKTMALGSLLADGMAGIAAVNQCGSSDQFTDLWLLAIGLLPSACLVADIVVTRAKCGLTGGFPVVLAGDNSAALSARRS